VFALAAASTILGALTLGEQGWLAAKACTARVLIDRAFEAHLEDGRDHAPWSWADVHPIARLAAPRLGVERIVLSGASGSSLAFGPGHIDGTAPPGEPGNVAIAGHRNGAFAFLGQLRAGDELTLETRAGARRYFVRDLRVVSMWDESVLEPTPEDRLTLITCWPLDGLVGSTERLVVSLDRLLVNQARRAHRRYRKVRWTRSDHAQRSALPRHRRTRGRRLVADGLSAPQRLAELYYWIVQF
jgi:sortase A